MLSKDGDGIDYLEFIECLDIMDASSQKKDTMQLSKQVLLLTNEVRSGYTTCRGFDATHALCR